MMSNLWDELDLGPTPTNEPCTQAPYKTDKIRHAAYEECMRYKAQLEKQFPPVSGTYIRVKSNPYGEFSYYSVIVRFYQEDESAVQYAFYLESNLPYHWEKEDDDATDS